MNNVTNGFTSTFDYVISLCNFLSCHYAAIHAFVIGKRMFFFLESAFAMN